MRIKNTFLLFVVLVIAVGLSACGTTPDTGGLTDTGEVMPASEIIMFNWTDYIDPGIYTLFEEEFGIKVLEDNFASNEELFAKIQGGVTGYSVVVPSDFTAGMMIQEGMFAELDHTNIPNIVNLREDFSSPDYDPELRYCVPYQWGTTGIGYLASKVDEPTSWAVLLEPDPSSPWYKRVTLLDDPRETFSIALIYLGYSINTTNEAELLEARDLLIRAKAGLAGYDSDTFENLVAAEELLLAHGWNGDFLVAVEDNEDLAYTIPEEGGVIFVENLCIPITATPQEKLAAEMFINFILRPDIGAMLSEYIYYASPNAAAEALLDPDFLNDPNIYPPADVMERLQFIENVGEAESMYQRFWDEVKAAP